MAMPTYTMRQLLEAGVHFGHRTYRWNPKMSGYIYGARNGIHIIDLQQTVPLLYRALEAVRDTVAGGGRALFVGTKRQAAEPVAAAAKGCSQYFVQHRWLGGMLTNWNTMSVSIKRLKALDAMSEEEALGLTKKERLQLERERGKLERALGGIKDMGGLPDILFVVDTNKEEIAVKEARKLGIPVAAVLDSNCDPEGIDYPIPGNDDASRAIALYCNLMQQAVLDGIREEMAVRTDVGDAAELPGASVPSEALADPAPAVIVAEAPTKAEAELAAIIPPAEPAMKSVAEAGLGTELAGEAESTASVLPEKDSEVSEKPATETKDS